MRRIPRFLQLPRSTKRIRSDVDDEIAFDIEMRARDLAAEGMSEEEARAQATREFGDIERTRDYCEDVDMSIEADERRAGFLEDIRSDGVIAWRAMRRTPVFAAVVLLTLALGIGANTAVFSVVRRVLIAPLPFRAPNELYRLYTIPSTVDGDDDKLSAIELSDLAAQSRSISAITSFGNYSGLTYTDDQHAEQWSTVSVSATFFDVLGIKPAIGRPFVAEDFVRGAAPKVIITYAVWRRVFGGDDQIVGKTVQLNANAFTLVGVLPENFVGPTFNRDALVPLNFENIRGDSRNARLGHSRIWRSIVRLRPDVSAQQFETEIAALRPRFETSYPDIKHAGAFIPKPLHAAIVGGAAQVLVMVMVGALIVLVVTCVNIAGLFLSRAAAQRREMGVRTALGAGRGRLIRQVLTESMLYGIVGGAAGLLLALAAKGALVTEIGAMLPPLGDIRIDAAVLVFAAAIAIGSGVAFGVFPAIAATRLDVRDALADGGSRGASQGKAGVRGSRVLVAVQIAFAVVLVIAAGLLTKTFIGLVRTNLGYATSSRQITFGVNLQGRFRYPAERGAFVATLGQRLHGIPGVTAFGYTVAGPWFGGWQHVGVRAEDRDANSFASIEYATASSEFFSAAGIPVRRGRVFGPSDRAGTPPVVVVSESVARRFWPSGNAVGSRVRLDIGDTTIAREVIGVVGDVRQSATSEIMPTVYVSAEQSEIYGQEFLVRTTGDGRALISGIKETLHSLDPKLPVPNPRMMSDVLSSSVKRQQLAMTLMVLFAMLSLVLATLGVYGIMAYTVLARTREFGIRAALGASRRAILVLVLRHGLATAVAGIATGMLMSLLLSRLIGSLLVGVSTHDLATFVAAPLILAVVALVACLAPARAATKVDPIEVLRMD